MTRVLFAVALLVGAGLLFLVELLTARLLLPLLGGSAAVWNTSLVFFQVALLAGYLYAHASARWLRGRFLPFLHPALLLVAAAILPVSVARLGAPSGDPLIWELGALTIMIGPPFVVMAGTASLLQAWYARSGAADARDPYYLYAASNFGSLAALVAYPTLIEPNLTLRTQSAAWTVGYAVLVVITAVCALLAARFAAAPAAPTPEVQETPAAAPRPWLTRLRWLVLAFVPSSLLLGVTSHLTMNVAAAPLLWAVPLTLYLLSFVVAFQRLVPVPAAWTAGAQAALVVVLALTLLNGEAGPSLPLFGINLAAFFATALLCHQEAARLRPEAARLTEFYLVIAAGGALGGMFNALIAPIAFDRVVEYPLMIVAAALLRPGPLPGRKHGLAAALDLAVPAALLLALLALILAGGLDFSDFNGDAQIFILLAGLIVFTMHRRPVRFALALAALILAGSWPSGWDARHEIARSRNFYGILRVVDRADPARRVLINGTIDHGTQSLDPARRLQPLSYYHPNGPLGQLFARIGGGPDTQSVALVGLGTGTIACYAHAGERWTYFEINPAVVRIASNPKLFTFLRDCPGHPGIVMGDARLSIARLPDHSLTLIVLDAFSSDAIPTHLMTREAMQLYLQKLTPGGLVVFHLSSQFLDLAPVVGAVARSMGLEARLFSDPHATDDAGANATTGTDYQDASDWAVVARTPADLEPVAGDDRWRPIRAAPGVRVWTDDYSDVFDAFLRRQRVSPSP